MSYARFCTICDPVVCPECPGSDVYIFDHVDGGIECCGCLLKKDRSEQVNFETPEEMQDHLGDHIAAGQHVPNRLRDGGFTSLWNLYNKGDDE